MYVKPAAGLVIRDPDLRDLLPASGREVPNTGYWQRRLLDGDVDAADPPEQPDADESADQMASEASVEAPIDNATNQGDA